MPTDLNDLAYFVQVVSHGGFAAAGRTLREPKSKLSRRIAGLEARLGVRLIERSSRRFRVTDVGRSYFERCRAMLDQAEMAEAVIAHAKAEPHGRVRFSCPTGLVEVVTPLILPFLARFPKVVLQLVATDRAVDLIEERIDLALRVRVALTSDASLTMRSLGTSARILVGSPQMASRIGGDITALERFPTLGTVDDPGEITWQSGLHRPWTVAAMTTNTRSGNHQRHPINSQPFRLQQARTICTKIGQTLNYKIGRAHV